MNVPSEQATSQQQAHPHTQVLMVVTSHGQLGDAGQPTGFWLSELAHPFFMLHDSGIAVDIVSIKGGEAVIDPRSKDEDDPDNRRFLADGELMGILNEAPPLRERDTADYQGILFVGGHGAMWDFPDDPAVKRAAAQMYEAGKVVAAVCHGAAALVNVTLSDGRYLIAGRQLTAFSDAEESLVELQQTVPFALQTRLAERGAKFVAASPWEEHVVVDGNLITGQNPQSAKSVGIAVVKYLKEKFHRAATLGNL